MNTLTLTWEGPWKLGNIPSECDGFSAVYLQMRCYTGKTIFYVGKANWFYLRVSEWYGGYLGANVGAIYRGDGSVFRGGGRAAFFTSVQNNFAETMRLASEDAHRLRFVYARCGKEELHDVEATLIDRCISNVKEPFLCDNGNQPIVKNDGGMIVNDVTKLNRDEFKEGEFARLREILRLIENPGKVALL